MNAFEALNVIKEVKQGLADSGEVEKLNAVNIAERALKDDWYIDMKWTDRELIKLGILKVIKENTASKKVTISFIESIFDEIMKDIKYEQYEINLKGFDKAD